MRYTDHSGLEWSFEEGLISLYPTEPQRKWILEAFQALLKRVSRLASPGAKDATQVMRVAYLYHEVLTRGELPLLDASDVDALYEVEDVNESNAWFFRTVNPYRFLLRRGEERVHLAMAMARDVSDVMTG